MNKIRFMLKFSIKKNFYNISFFVFISLFLLILFALKDLSIIFSNNSWNNLYAVINTPFINWEESVLYLPLIKNFSFSYLNNIPSFFPIITFGLSSIIYKYLCFSNCNLYLFISHVIFPIFSFWFLYLIFKKYIRKSWAVLLAFFGISFYNNFSSLKYIINLPMHWNAFVSSASLAPMEITRTPIPSISLLLFLIMFYLTIKTYKISFLNICLLSIGWAFQIYIYPFNFIAGIPFWLSYLVFITYLEYQKKQQIWKAVLLRFITNILLIGFILIPALIIFFNNTNNIDNLIISANSNLLVTNWGISLSYILPIILLLLVILINCSDYYELFYRFFPIFLMIIIEIIILNSHFILGRAVQPYLFSLRIGNFFTRFLYFLPIIYFLCNPSKKIYHRNINSKLLNIFKGTSEYIFLKNRFILTSICIILLSIVVFASNLKYVNNHFKNTASEMQKITIYYNELTENNYGILISENMAVNMFLALNNTNSAFIVNTFNTNTTKENVLNRLLLFSYIFNWDEVKFLNFMLPNDDSNKIFTDNNFIVSEKFLQNGFGYWLLFQNKNINEKDLLKYKHFLINRFRTFNLANEFPRYSISNIQAFTEINKALPYKTKQIHNNSIIYTF